MLVSWKWVLPVCIIIVLLNENLMNILGLILQNSRFGVYLTGKFAEGRIFHICLLQKI